MIWEGKVANVSAWKPTPEAARAIISAAVTTPWPPSPAKRTTISLRPAILGSLEAGPTWSRVRDGPRRASPACVSYYPQRTRRVRGVSIGLFGAIVRGPQTFSAFRPRARRNPSRAHRQPHELACASGCPQRRWGCSPVVAACAGQRRRAGAPAPPWPGRRGLRSVDTGAGRMVRFFVTVDWNPRVSRTLETSPKLQVGIWRGCRNFFPSAASFRRDPSCRCPVRPLPPRASTHVLRTARSACRDAPSHGARTRGSGVRGRVR